MVGLLPLPHIGATSFMWKKRLGKRRLNRESWPSSIRSKYSGKMIQQLLPFPPSPALPSRPFPCWTRALDEIRICSRCGRDIATRRRSAGGRALSEFMSPDGQCYAPARKKAQHNHHTTRLYG